MTTIDAGTGTAPWQAMHIFYAADPRPVLTDCVAPLVRDLRTDGLIDRYFFIHYWIEGPHVRLRLRPSTADGTGEVRRRAETAVTAFLTERPALYEPDVERLGGFYDRMFEAEYTLEDRVRMFPDGAMPIHPTNAFSYRPYEPEYGRYGGPDGIDLAEWHFEHSSDMVLDLVGTMNVHMRSVMLGLSAQMMMIMTSVFLSDIPTMRNYLERYHRYWGSAFGPSTTAMTNRYHENYASMSASLAERFAEIHSAVQGGRTDRLTAFRSRWAGHCAELRERVLTAGAAGGLVFPPRSGDGPARPVTAPSVLLPLLLTPYMHMTNNRLGTTPTDETYLAFLLMNSLRDHEPVA